MDDMGDVVEMDVLDEGLYPTPELHVSHLFSSFLPNYNILSGRM